MFQPAYRSVPGYHRDRTQSDFSYLIWYRDFQQCDVLLGREHARTNGRRQKYYRTFCHSKIGTLEYDVAYALNANQDVRQSLHTDSERRRALKTPQPKLWTVEKLFPDDGPTPSYSPFRYWAPGLGHLHDNCRGPKLSVYPPDRHPEIVPDVLILKFPCPAARPGDTLIPTPTPPADSRFKY